MTRNVGTLDRAARIVIALALFSLFVFVDGPMKWIGSLGVVMLVTAALGFCPLYRLVGINTCPVKPHQA